MSSFLSNYKIKDTVLYVQKKETVLSYLLKYKKRTNL